MFRVPTIRLTPEQVEEVLKHRLREQDQVATLEQPASPGKDPTFEQLLQQQEEYFAQPY